MTIKNSPRSFGWLIVASILLAVNHGVNGRHHHFHLGRRTFPPGFVFGTASAAYQYEGAAREGGRGPSIWDTYSHTPGKINGGTNGDVAVDQYHRYKEDVKMMKRMGVDAYRFSISWSRILPKGSPKGGINVEGVEYYNNLINELLNNGIKPFITLFHWDLPQALEDEYGGFLSSNIVYGLLPITEILSFLCSLDIVGKKDYAAFAEVCFQAYGDRVKHWITLNEPYMYASGGYDTGTLAPGRCSSYSGNCTAGNSATEPYIVAHNLLLSHAAAVRVYKNRRSWLMQMVQNGSIGITIVSHWMLPFSKTLSDKRAADTAVDFMLGWNLNLAAERNGVPIGPRAGSDWLYVYPPGIRDLLKYTKDRYNNPPVFITGNGIDELNNDGLSLKEALNDTWRIDYHAKHLSHVRKAIWEGSDVRGYFAWSLLDNFEWRNGYTVRFGIHYVDYKHNLTRYPKASAHWFRKFLKD
eukprot:Gb_04454 [translate_table: standard]